MLSWNAVLQTAFLALAIGGCAGGGCSSCASMEPIPGGFPTSERSANAMQVRLTSSAIAAIEADPAALVGNFLGGGGLEFNIPASCTGTEICCEGGTPAAVCGPLDIDLEEQNGDLPRLEIVPVSGQQTVNVTLRARMQSASSIPIKVSGISCDISIDTSAGSRDEVTIVMGVELPLDADEDTTRIEVEQTTVDFEDSDIILSGGILCDLSDALIKGTIVDLLTAQIENILKENISDAACQACPSGTTDECGAFAEECIDNICMIGDRCEQRLGISGRLAASALFGGSGQLGAMDIYEVAGGYTETDNDGVSLGLYSGALPFAERRDRCGPPAVAPTPTTIPQSAFFQGNVRPDTGEAFGVGIGIHQQVLDQFAFASYESGALCFNLGPDTIDLLTTDGLAPLIMPSATELLHGENSPLIMAVRPQSPPTIAIGPGTTSTGENGETLIEDPLLDVRFDDMEIDFYIQVDQQFIRAMTMSIDVALPINLEINEIGEIQPVVGDLEEAITDVKVSNSQALRESDEELAEKIPLLLSLALPGIVDGLGSFALPEIGGLNLSIPEGGLLSIENNSFLAIFADLSLAETTMQTRVQTVASIRQLQRGETPTAHLSLGGDGANLEFSFQVDGGLWSPYTQSTELALSRGIFKLAGEHTILVRAREVGKAWTTDLSPASLTALFSIKTTPTAFHGKGSGDGCACNSTSSSSGWLIALFVLGLLYWKQRRMTATSSITPIATLFIAGFVSITGQACSCSSDAAGCPDGCLEGEVLRGPTGRYNSMASSEGRVVSAAYDELLGDLVLIEADSEGALQYKAIAGIPDDVPPTYEPKTYRGGIAAAGPDVGIWTSIQLHEGLAYVAYVDRDLGSVHLAIEQRNGEFFSEEIDANTGRGGASYVDLAIASDGTPSVTYLVTGLPASDNGTILSELRYATKSNNWAKQVVDVGPISCAGFCEESQACVALGDVQECVVASSDCEGGCADTEACVTGTCQATIAVFPDEVPEGVGLFANLLYLPNGTQVLGYYDRIVGALKIATSSGSDFSQVASFQSETLDVGTRLSQSHQCREIADCLVAWYGVAISAAKKIDSRMPDSAGWGEIELLADTTKRLPSFC